jgi:hypothetical protein
LLVNSERIDIVACGRAAEVVHSEVLFTFSGTVDRTTHPTLSPDADCTGSVVREPGMWKAIGKVVCGGATIYVGTSPIVIDRGAEDGRVRLDYFDDARATNAKFSFGDTRDIVRVWSTDPVWEVEIKMTAESTK